MITTPATITTTTTEPQPDAVPTQLVRGFLVADTKTGPIASANGRTSESVRNATWLPSGPPDQGGTCPGATTYCHRTPNGKLTCYARRLELGRPTLAAIVEQRITIWGSLNLEDKTNLAAAMLEESHRSQTQPGTTSLHTGAPVRSPSFRIGAGGDLATLEDGQAWANAITWAHDHLPNLKTWLYTRSYGLYNVTDPAQPLADLTRRLDGNNLTLYLSTDPAMTPRTKRALATTTYGHLPIAALADTVDHAHNLLDYLDQNRVNNPRRIVCPVDDGRLTITTNRHGTNHNQGACASCRACWNIPTTHAPDIIFIKR